MIHIVGPNGSTHEFLEHVVLFVGALGRRETCDTVRAVRFLDVLQTHGHMIECLVPTGFLELTISFDHRRGQPFGALDKIHAETSLDTQVAVIGNHAHRAGDTHDLIALVDVHVDLAAHTAIHAGGSGAPKFEALALALGSTLVQGARGAGGDALAAEFAGRVVQGHVESGGDLGLCGPVLEGEGRIHLHLIADSDAPAASDALVSAVLDGLIARGIVVLGRGFAGGVKGLVANLIFIAVLLQPALTVFVARGTHAPVLVKQEFQHRLSEVANVIRVCLDVHAVGDLKGAGRDRILLSLDLHHTQPAGSGRLQPRVMAQVGDLNAMLSGDLEYRTARSRGDLLSVQGNRYRITHRETPRYLVMASNLHTL